MENSVLELKTDVNINTIITTAVDAGKEILKIYQQDNITQYKKSDNSPLTEADLAAHQLIVQRLQELTPDIPILSEESANIPWSERQKWHRYWLVDPLDGTKEFIKRNGEFTVNIALVEGHEPVMGVVHAPVLDITWAGESNKPAIKIQQGEKKNIKVRQRHSSEPWKVVGSRSHAGDSLMEFLAKLGEYELVSMGSSIKLCLIADGTADIYPRLGLTSEWDTAAAHAVVNAAGGEVIIADGEQPLLYNTKEALLNPYFIVRPASNY